MSIFHTVQSCANVNSYRTRDVIVTPRIAQRKVIVATTLNLGKIGELIYSSGHHHQVNGRLHHAARVRL